MMMMIFINDDGDVDDYGDDDGDVADEYNY